MALFGFADAAGCVVETAAVEIEGEDHDDEHGDEAHADEEHHEEGEHAEAEHEHHEDEHAEHEGEESHNEFHATYALACSAPDALDGLDPTGFFGAFEGAEEVEVTVISEQEQSSVEVERDAPAVDLQGVI